MYITAAGIMVAAGLFAMFVCIFGIIGALRESRFMILGVRYQSSFFNCMRKVLQIHNTFSWMPPCTRVECRLIKQWAVKCVAFDILTHMLHIDEVTEEIFPEVSSTYKPRWSTDQSAICWKVFYLLLKCCLQYCTAIKCRQNFGWSVPMSSFQRS